MSTRAVLQNLAVAGDERQRQRSRCRNQEPVCWIAVAGFWQICRIISNGGCEFRDAHGRTLKQCQNRVPSVGCQ